MDGIVDQVIVTNGEAGHQYSAPAEAYYRLSIGVGQEASRKDLVRIRRREVLRAGRILGIRHHYFLNERDTGVTLDPRQGFGFWDIERIRRGLLALLESEKYDLVFMLLPAPDTHGHHQTVAVLAIEAISSLKAEQRPGAVGVQTLASGAAHAEVFRGLEEFPLTRTTHPEPVWEFDRRTRMRCHHALEYSIVANWVTAEHKSQGMFQMESGRRTHESFWLFDACGAAGAARWHRFLQMIGRDLASDEDNRGIGSNAKFAAASSEALVKGISL
jgi:LmbE family N-acetylglucosaminyl deacetylase